MKSDILIFIAFFIILLGMMFSLSSCAYQTSSGKTLFVTPFTSAKFENGAEISVMTLPQIIVK